MLSTKRTKVLKANYLILALKAIISFIIAVKTTFNVVTVVIKSKAIGKTVKATVF